MLLPAKKKKKTETNRNRCLRGMVAERETEDLPPGWRAKQSKSRAGKW